MPRKFGTADFTSGLALAALATYIILQARQWEYLGPDGPGPGFFPLWYGIAMAALSGVLVVSSMWREKDTGRVKWQKIGRALAVWLAAASAAAFHVLFPLALGVPLPAGVLGF
jgi:putative tricarboxylic transport membrane protein